MTSVSKATPENASLIAEIGRVSFVEAHSKSASAKDIEAYTSLKYAVDVTEGEIKDPANLIHLIHHEGKPAGFSKIRFDTPDPVFQRPGACKLDRLYLLSGFYGLGLGKTLLEFNARLAKQANQAGLWLYVWVGNERAISFYRKNGFEIFGQADFKLSETHSNPNHLMWKDL